MLDPIQNLTNKLLELGCDPTEAVMLIADVIASERDHRTVGAIRQARYRDRQKALQTSQGVTKRNEVTISDATPLPPCPPSPSDKEKVPTPLKEINSPSPLNPPSPHVLSARNSDFSAFYQRYPHKVGKPAAEKSFLKAIKKATIQQIMAGLDAYVASKPPDRPWCNPSTWLNQERWNDQPAQVQLAAKPLSFREANTLRNQEIINAVLGQPKLREHTETEKSHRQALGGPALRIVPQSTGDDFNF